MSILKAFGIALPVASGIGLTLLMSGGGPPAVHEMILGAVVAVLVVSVEALGWVLWRVYTRSRARRQQDASSTSA